MCFFQEEGPLLIRDLVCKSEFLFGCFLEVLKNYKLSNRFQLGTPDLWYINTAAPWLLRWDDSLCAFLHRAPDVAPRSQLQSPTTITHLISHSSLLPPFPCLISPFPYLCWTSQIIYLYWNLGLGGLLQGVPTPRQTFSMVPGSLETLRVKWLGYQGSQRSLHLLSGGKTSLHAT